MEKINNRIVFGTAFALFVVLASLGLLEAKDPKLSPGELVSRHLKSIGASEKLSARKTCTLEGDGAWRIVDGSGPGSLSGPSTLVSEGDKIQFIINFNHLNYPAEQFVYDGEKFDVGYIRDGLRSRLGQFLYTYDFIVKEGLMGGVLSTRWALAELEKRNPRLYYDGVKKIAGKDAHELRYVPRKGKDLNVYLYFDAETYRHVATLYRLVIPAQIVAGSPTLSISQKEKRYELEERFDNFKEVEGLMLPTHWNIRYTVDAEASSVAEWDMNYSKFSVNQPVQPKAFTIQ
ncbi:MAG: hypothetical protein LAO21_16995 [Acidobacteriia bacterium]|nr:hypothetical protein [Terriglobia bacterium]